MTDDKARTVRALQMLGRRVQHGLPKLAPVSQESLAKVRAAVRQQWAATHRAQAQAEGSATVSPAKKTKQQQQSKAKSQDRSQDHGHSY